MSSGREKKIQIGGQMSIAKNTSTTLVNVIRSIACLCQYQICFSKPWLCWLSKAGHPSTVRSDRIEPVTKKENDTHQVISIRWFCSFWFPFNVINYHQWIHKPHQMTFLYMLYQWSFDTSCTWLILNVTNKWERLKCSKLLLAPN